MKWKWHFSSEILGEKNTQTTNTHHAKYLASIGKYNVIIVDLSCSVVKYGNEGFTDRDIRHLNWKQKQDGSLLNNPYKHDWQNDKPIKKKRKREVTIPEESEREVTIPEESESFMVPEF